MSLVVLVSCQKRQVAQTAVSAHYRICPVASAAVGLHACGMLDRHPACLLLFVHIADGAFTGLPMMIPGGDVMMNGSLIPAA
jgi:hypothetical protein